MVTPIRRSAGTLNRGFSKGKNKIEQGIEFMEWQNMGLGFSIFLSENGTQSIFEKDKEIVIKC